MKGRWLFAMEARNWREVLFTILFSRVMKVVFTLCFLGLLLWSFRFPILRQMGEHLAAVDPLDRVEVVYVLGGASLERGEEAAVVIEQGFAPRAVFTGGNVPSVLEAEGIAKVEAQVSLDAAVRAGLDPVVGEILAEGTSTMEEAIAILAHAKAHGYTKVMILSSTFHMRRVGFVFRDRFRKEGIEVILHGAKARTYSEERWWESEEGLLTVNNEYTKLVYYWLKY